jgi:hypothetical protein
MRLRRLAGIQIPFPSRLIMKIHSLAAGITALLFATLHASPVAAATTNYVDVQQGSGACQPAREYPDLRMRQKEVDNIGTTNAYIICSPQVHYIGGVVLGVQFQFVNNSDVVRTFRCTMQNDYLDSNHSIPNVVREVTVAPGESGAVLFGEGDDFSNPEVQMPGVQCILPPSTSLAYMLMSYNEVDADT